MIIRALEHIFMDMGLVCALFLVLEYYKRSLDFLLTLRSRLLIACLIVALVTAGREALDLHSGQAYAKIWSDWASHVIGILGGGWFGILWLVRKEDR